MSTLTTKLVSMPPCVCGDPASEHRVGFNGGQVRHLGCTRPRCRCHQYEPNELAEVTTVEPEPVPAAPRVDIVAAPAALDEQIAVVDQAPAAAAEVLRPDDEPATPAKPARPKHTPAPRRPKVTAAPAPVPGVRLDWWDAFLCLKCRSRYFLPNDCCGQTTLPVTVTVTVREVSR